MDGFVIEQSEEEIGRRIMRALVPEVNALFESKQDCIKNVVQHEVFVAILESPTYTALQDGTLRYELGLLNPTERLTNILVEIGTNIEVDLEPVKFRGDAFLGGITVRAIKGDYSDILNLPDAIQMTEKGEELYWLGWLLKGGKDVLIADYHVQFGQYKTSRTGGALMFKSGDWSLGQRQAQHAGTEGNNFITRAIAGIQDKMGKKIIKCLASA